MGFASRVRKSLDLDGFTAALCFRMRSGSDMQATPAAKGASADTFSCPLYEDAKVPYNIMSVGYSSYTLSSASNAHSIQPTKSQASSSECWMSAKSMAANFFEEHRSSGHSRNSRNSCQPTTILHQAFGSAQICDDQWHVPTEDNASSSEADAVLEITPRYCDLPAALCCSRPRGGDEWSAAPSMPPSARASAVLQPLLLSAANVQQPLLLSATNAIIASSPRGHHSPVLAADAPHHHHHQNLMSSCNIHQAQSESGIFMTSSSSLGGGGGGGGDGGGDDEGSCYMRRRRGTGESASSGGPDTKLNLNIDYASLTVHRDRVLGSSQSTTVCMGEYQGQPVAVKLLLDMLHDSGRKDLQAFNQELACFQALSHANVVKCFGGSQAPPHVFIVEELMDRTLANLLYAQPRQRMTMRQILSIGLDIAHGLEYIHQLTPAIIHRDLKPANILMTASGRAKISDFGLARFKLSSCVQTERRSAGTLVYMAPECFDPAVGRITEQCDLFSFGVVMWELCTGIPPWEGYTATEFLQRMVIDGARLAMPVDDLTCPMALRDIISQCWSHDPADRPPCRDIVSVLTRMLRYTTY